MELRVLGVYGFRDLEVKGFELSCGNFSNTSRVQAHANKQTNKPETYRHKANKHKQTNKHKQNKHKKTNTKKTNREHVSRKKMPSEATNRKAWAESQ